jgi:hypothetical protein
MTNWTGVEIRMMQKDFFIMGKDEEQVSEKGKNYL